MAMSVVQVSMEVWAFPGPDADDDFHECDTSFWYDLFNAGASARRHALRPVRICVDSYGTVVFALQS